jgi:glycosyltransferase involved in cell wall biosynthesis
MRIVTVMQCTNLGGMEHNARMLLEEFKGKGIQCEVLSLNAVGNLGPVLEARGIPAHGIDYCGKWGWHSFFRVRRILRGAEADGLVMVGHNLMGMLAMGGLCRGHRVLCIHYHHAGVKPDWQWRLIYRVAACQFRKVLFVSDYIMAEAVAIAPFLAKRATMIGTPVAECVTVSPESRRTARRKLGIPTDAKVAGNAGWLVPRKRWDVFLAVAGKVARSVPGAAFLVAGDGPERAELEQKAKALGIGNQIIWLGWVGNLADFYQSLDVLLFNSDWDAQPRTPLEAMSFGVPVVASILNGGTREVITGDSVGVLLPTHDVESLARHVVALLEDRKLAHELGKGGAQRVKAYCSPKRHAAAVLLALEMKYAPTDEQEGARPETHAEHTSQQQ